jgi:uroporphyrinogen decarboxylase
MRQAGRSLPEYLAARADIPMLDACLTPELASELTLQPVRRHRVDAAILFSDIVVPLRLAGVGVEIVAGRGPVVAEPIRSAADIRRLAHLDPAQLRPVSDAVALTTAQLGQTPLIGFAGAPFTLASYLVEGGPSKDQLRARALMHADPEVWAALLAWCADVAGRFLRAQVDAGASAVQLFDSWVGSLSRADYERHVAPYSARALDPVRDTDVPVIHFGVGAAHLLDLMLLGGQEDPGVDALGIDWRLPLDEASARLGDRVGLQGNIDPALLSAPWPVLRSHVRDVVARGRRAPGHVLNLGHGVPPETDPDVLSRIVRLVRGEDDDAG